MKKLIIANLKMNLVQEETREYLSQLIPLIENSKNEIVVCFPYTNLSLASQMLFGKKILIGAQNVHNEESGAYTGEISAKMLKDFACEYVLVGHSERRAMGEKNKVINLKIKTLLKFGIKPVLCIGETIKEKEIDKTKFVLKQQLEQALAGLYENELKSIVIAYEPIWAIGTGENATVKIVLDVVKYIRDIIEQNYSLEASKNIQILYGGSVKQENSKSYLQHEQINGALVGSASLDAKSFALIVD